MSNPYDVEITFMGRLRNLDFHELQDYTVSQLVADVWSKRIYIRYHEHDDQEGFLFNLMRCLQRELRQNRFSRIELGDLSQHFPRFESFCIAFTGSTVQDMWMAFREP